jgi:FixJ family two-component response regulator
MQARKSSASRVERERCLEAAMSSRTLISIVDDDEPYRDSMRKLTMLLGYTVEAFASAADFLRSRHLSDTACLVADVHMPGMSGVELHRHLVDAGYTIPTILVTAYPDEVVRDQALKDGVVCYLSKPVDDDFLDRCLRSALQPGSPIKDNS